MGSERLRTVTHARCIVLGVDPGATAGWALMRPPSPGVTMSAFALGLAATGTATNARGIVAAVDEALALAAASGLPLVAVVESWRGSTGKGQSAGKADPARVFGGLGARAGRWLMVLEAAADAELRERMALPGRMAKRRILRAHVSEWAKGLGLPTRMKTATRQARTRAWVARRFGVDVSHDVAAAVCLAVYAQRAAKVAAVLPKEKRCDG